MTLRRRRRLRDAVGARARRRRARRVRARDGRVRVPARGPDAGAAVGAAGPGGLRRGAARRRAGRGRGGRTSTPGHVRRHRHRLHRQLAAARACRRHAASAHVRLWKHHAAQRQADRINAAGARRAVAGALRRAHLLRVGGGESAAAARGGAGAVRAHGPLDRGRRLDHVAAVRARDAQRRRSPATRPSTRTAPIPAARSWARSTPGSRTWRTSSTVRSCRWEPAPAPSPPERRRGRACDPGSRWRWATSTPTSPRPRPAPIDPGQMLMIMGTSTCHVMSGERLVEVPGMCGVVRDGIVPGLYGYEAGQTGVGDCFAWIADLAGDEHERLSAARRGAGGRRARAARARLAQRQPLRARRPRAQRRARRPHARHPRRRTSTARWWRRPPSARA